MAGPNPTTIYVRRVKETKIVDPLTVHVVTDGAAPNLPNDFIRLFIVSSKAAAGLTKETANEAFNSGKAAIGTGPYKYVSWQPKGDLVLARNDSFWGPKEPWARHVRKEIANDAARVAQLKAGQLDLISRVPATDVDALKRDAKINVQTIDTVYVFNIELDMRDKALNVATKDGSRAGQESAPGPARARGDRSRHRSQGAGDGGHGRPRQACQARWSRRRSSASTRRSASASTIRPRRASCLPTPGYPNGFRLQFSFTQDRLPGDRQVGTSIAQMLAAIGIDAQANAQPAAVFFPARTRGEYSMSMSGWGTLTGEAHYTLSSLAHSNDKDRKMGAFNVLGYKNPAMDKLLQDAAVEMDEAKRRKLLEDANALLEKDRQRLPVVAVGSAWAMQKDKVTIKSRVDEDTLAMNIKPAK